MKEQIVSFETAKLAKEKGFNWPTLFYAFKNFNAGLDYVSVTDIYSQFGTLEKTEDHNNADYVCKRISLPTQSLLQTWLRDTKKLVVEPSAMDIFKESDVREYCYFIHKVGSRICSLPTKFQSYEEALEAGLVEALNLL